MIRSIQGKAFVFGANIDTDQIYPGRYLDLTDADLVAQHAMEGADPDFVKLVQPGDIIVAKTNFGCGSSREHAAITLKSLGIGAILAESFARIFYRNGINLGLPLIVVPGIGTKVKTGDQLSVDIQSGLVINNTSGEKIKSEQISQYMFNILDNGGIKGLIKEQYKK
ncbi:MAG TPA: 3-isopropylmalate dehydratase small subunit [Syntrophomonas sp.]|nr:3-isopropylmalate dehydratase small subunit [Syntrophomonas sp.]